jgi:hypothetical protein
MFIALAGRGMTGAPLIGSGINRENEAVWHGGHTWVRTAKDFASRLAHVRTV